MQQIDMPDTEHREELESLLSDLKQAHQRITTDSTGSASEGAYKLVGDARAKLSKAITEVSNELDEEPEWDEDLVRSLVLEHAGASRTTTERLDNEVVLRFEAGNMGRETYCRYAVEVTTGSEWFHTRKDSGDDWTEVWSN